MDINIKETPEQLVIKDAPGCTWLFSSFFLAIGSIFVLGPLFFNSDRFDQPWYVNLLGITMGAIAVATGLWIIGRTPASTVIFDRLLYRVILRQGWRKERRERSWSWKEVSEVRVKQEKDSDGDPVYRLQLVLRSGEVTWLTQVSSPSRASSDRAVEKIRQFTGWKTAG
jgi:hypothetical protein